MKNEVIDRRDRQVWWGRSWSISWIKKKEEEQIGLIISNSKTFK
jgi:hypothetical protein